MSTPLQPRINQSGVIPYRFVSGQLQIKIISSRDGKRWGVPKGNLGRGLQPDESAAREAYEEAGLLGAIRPEPVGHFIYEKRGTPRVVQLYAMTVTSILPRWPEMDERQRLWLDLHEAVQRISRDDLARHVESLPALLPRLPKPVIVYRPEIRASA